MQKRVPFETLLPGGHCHNQPSSFRWRPVERHLRNRLLAIVLLSSVSFPVPLLALGKNTSTTDAASSRSPEWTSLDGNSVRCTIASDGPYADYRENINPQTGANPGLEWPKGSGKTPLFTAGLWIAGYHAPSGAVRTAVMHYGTEYQVGPIPEEFSTSTNDDRMAIASSFDRRYRLYKIDRFAPEGDPQRGLDRWSDWPGDLGAPYQDLNANSIWDPTIDVPEFTGRQMVWTLFNDANNSLHAVLGTTAPMGIEVQCLYSAFNLRGPLDSAMVIRWRIINKSDADYRDVYLGLWSDPDLGDANDDLPGSDSSLNLGYVYNGDSLDGTLHGYDSIPPALGFQILQGPLVDGESTDTARFYGRLIPGRSNLGASSFVAFLKVFIELVDPPQGNAEHYARMAYDWLLGKAGVTGDYLMRPDGTPYPLFWFSGDPTTDAGDLPSNFPLGRVNPQDLRVMLSTGPFVLGRGDTQEVVGAVLLTHGANRLESVTRLQRHARFIQDMFDNDFHGLNVPQQPGDILQKSFPTQFILGQNYPNPFNPGTTLEYELPEPAGVQLRVFDCFGREIKTLVQSHHPSGFFSANWDGTDVNGKRLASGVYLARFEALREDGTMRISTRKMLLLK